MYAVWLHREKKTFLSKSEKLHKTAICKLADNMKLILLTKKLTFSLLITQILYSIFSLTPNICRMLSVLKWTQAIHKATVASNKDSLRIKQEGSLLLSEHRPF